MAPKVFVEKICRCGKTFRTSNDSDECYDCTLDDICHGNPPEEGDFNTAGIVSGTLTNRECSYLQQDLESVELGRTTQEEYEEEEDEEYYPDEEAGDDWEEEEEPEEDTSDDFVWNIDAQNQAARFGEEG